MKIKQTQNYLQMKNNAIILILGFVIASFYSCKTNNVAEIGYNEVINDYHNAYFDTEKNATKNENFGIYVDFSSGMKIAFNDTKTLGFYELFINSLKLSKVDFHEVANNEVTKFANYDKGNLYKIVKDKSRYNKINAPLDVAINKIVAEGRESVFITDGELWQNAERDDPWAREAFEKWLKAGGTITFFVTDHADAKKQKHLFYMFFIPEYKANDGENIVTQFKYYLENSSEAKSYSYKNFTFNNNGFKIVQEYPNETSGGANTNLEIDPTTFINCAKKGNFEYHEYLLNWQNIVTYIREATDDDGNSLKGGEPIISKLFIETDNFEFYSIEELDIKVYDIKKDIDKLILCRDCRQNQPIYETDENGQRLLDADNQPIISQPGSIDCYDETGKLIIDTVFVAKDKLPETAELFVFDNEAFKNNIVEQNRGEVIVKVHKNFDGQQISSEDENLHRVDIILKKVQINTSDPNLENFIWDGKQVAKNRSIYNSILGALNAANPQGKIIYSYYIKTSPNDYRP